MPLVFRTAAFPAERGAVPAGTLTRPMWMVMLVRAELYMDIGLKVVGEIVRLFHGRVLCHHEMEVDEPVRPDRRVRRAWKLAKSVA